MPRDPKKRQKQVERRKARRKQKALAETRRKSVSVADQMRQAAVHPVLHCCTTATLFEEGLDQVLLSRSLPTGQVATAVFLVDCYCLGLKDAFARVLPHDDYLEHVYERFVKDKPVLFKPECARKLVEGAVDYAQGLGFAPHANYRKAAPLFGDVDAAACPEEFEYGRDGQPVFISGPYDDQSKINRVMNTLSRTVGEGNYSFMLLGSHRGLPGLVEVPRLGEAASGDDEE